MKNEEKVKLLSAALIQKKWGRDLSCCNPQNFTGPAVMTLVKSEQSQSLCYLPDMIKYRPVVDAYEAL